MASERWRRTEAIFDEAAALPAAERGAFLARACGEDLDLRREIESLLEADEKAAAFLEQPSGSPAAPPPALSAAVKSAMVFPSSSLRSWTWWSDGPWFTRRMVTNPAGIWSGASKA